MSQFAIDLWTVAVACLASLTCGLLGLHLVLRRMSMVGDAISHSVLPGLAAAFVLFGSRGGWPTVLGAAAAGLATVGLMRGVRWLSGAREDASLGIAFTVLFALGVVMVTRVASQVDLDPGCVLYGLLEFVALDTVVVAGVETPRAFATLLPTFAATAIGLGVFRRELAFGAFDPAYATTLGRRPGWVETGLLALVALATVASFEAVGSILVVAMLVAPGSAALLLTRRLRTAFVLAGIFSVVGACAGYWLAVAFNTSAAGMIAVFLGALYGICAIWAFLRR